MHASSFVPCSFLLLDATPLLFLATGSKLRTGQGPRELLRETPVVGRAGGADDGDGLQLVGVLQPLRVSVPGGPYVQELLSHGHCVTVTQTVIQSVSLLGQYVDELGGKGVCNLPQSVGGRCRGTIQYRGRCGTS